MEPKEEGLLEKSPGSLKQQILSRGIIKLGIFYAAIMVVGTSLVYLILTSLGCTNPQIRTGIFLSLIIFQWFNTFNCRSPNKSVFTIGFFKNRLLLIFLLINIFLVAILFIFPALTNTFDIAPLGILELLIIVGIASTIWLLDEVRKRYRLLFIRD